jgi:hypothetical protein
MGSPASFRALTAVVLLPASPLAFVPPELELVVPELLPALDELPPPELWPLDDPVESSPEPPSSPPLSPLLPLPLPLAPRSPPLVPELAELQPANAAAGKSAHTNARPE